MSAAVFYKTLSSLSVPHTQNTAPVLEFNCLYTHDLRRKQKRWQDGFLRFHTFNKRIMVYDVPRNLIGDAHWSSEEHPQEGDEVTLDKGSALVQISDIIGQTETDLTELRRSVRKPPPSLSAGTRAEPPPACALVTLGSAKRKQQSKHRSLTSLLSERKNPPSRGQNPLQSPFDLRQGRTEARSWEDEGASKRPRIDATCGSIPLLSAKLDKGQEHLSNKPDAPSLRKQRYGGNANAASDRVSVYPSDHQAPLSLSSRRSPSPFVTPEEATPVAERRNSYDDDLLSTQEPVNGPSPTRDFEKQPPQLLPRNIPIAPDDNKSSSVLKIPVTAPKRKVLLCQTNPFGPSLLEIPESKAHDFGTNNNEFATDFSQFQQRELQRRLDRVTRDPDQSMVQPSEAVLLTSEQGITKPTAAGSKQRESEKAPCGEVEVETSKEAVGIPHHASISISDGPLAISCTHTLARTTSKEGAAEPQTSATRKVNSLQSENTASHILRRMAAPRINKPGDGRRKMARLDVSAYGPSTVLLQKPFRAQKPASNTIVPTATASKVSDPEPWSREAFDLFTWRPPGWNEEKWCIDDTTPPTP